MWKSKDAKTEDAPKEKKKRGIHISIDSNDINIDLGKIEKQALKEAASGLRDVGDAMKGKFGSDNKLHKMAHKFEERAKKMEERSDPHPVHDSQEYSPPPTGGAGFNGNHGTPGGQRGRQDREASHHHKRRDEVIPGVTIGEAIWFVIALFIAPAMLVISIVVAIGPLITTASRLVTALITTIYACFGVITSPTNGRRIRGLFREAGDDWVRVGSGLKRSLYVVAPLWGLGGLVKGVGRRISEMSGRYERYATAVATPENTPKGFRDDYLVIDQLPSGGSTSQIYVVKKADKSDEELYVLKYFDLHDGSKLEAVMRESQSVELAKRLNLIIDSHLGDTSFYYVMPYYRGETLTKHVLDSVHDLPSGDAPKDRDQWLALSWIHQLLQLLAQYHESGVMHKDIKPDNLIVNGEYLYLVDIGLLTPLESVQQLTTHGTEYFRDPDMVKLALQGKQVRDVDASKFDIYAVGAVLYFCFEGEFPTTGSLSRFERAVPRAIQMVVSKAMAPIDRRYSDARKMLADIDYLVYASAQGRLGDVRPADLPSFRSDSSVDVVSAPPQIKSGSYEAPPLSAPAYPPIHGEPAFSGHHQRRSHSPWRVVMMVVVAFMVFGAVGGCFALFWGVTAVDSYGTPVMDQSAASEQLFSEDHVQFKLDEHRRRVDTGDMSFIQTGEQDLRALQDDEASVILNGVQSALKKMRDSNIDSLCDLSATWPVILVEDENAGHVGRELNRKLRHELVQRNSLELQYAHMAPVKVNVLELLKNYESVRDAETQLLDLYNTGHVMKEVGDSATQETTFWEDGVVQSNSYYSFDMLPVYLIASADGSVRTFFPGMRLKWQTKVK